MFLGQSFESTVDDDGTHTLQAVEYGYTLTPDAADQPILRWEYVRRPPDPAARWCRHHLQGPVPLPLGERREARLNDLHLPTGHVALEEVLRFCIVDLGVTPLSKQWHDELLRSHEVTATIQTEHPGTT